MDAVFPFMDHFIKIRFEDIPTPALEAAKKQVLDSLATASGGACKPGIAELVDMIKEWGGSEQSTIVAYGIKCPAPHAAQVNSSMIHALDYDDGHQQALVHIGTITVSTCFAVAERMGQVSGKKLLTAMTLGADFLCRLGLASRPNTNIKSGGFHPTTLFGCLGAAAMAGKIMGLDATTLAHAVGLAYHQCSGAGTGVEDGALAKRMGPGMAVKSGICAALMAERGITGTLRSLEGETGLFNKYMDGDYDRNILLSGLGERFEGMNVAAKPYPCCGLTHACIDAALALREKHDIRPDRIRKIRLFVGSSAYDLTQPPEVKSAPRTIVDAQFSVPFVVATALAKGKVTLDDFSDEGIRQEKILKIAQKITAHRDAALDRHGVEPGRVCIIMEDGGEFEEQVEHCLGSVERPMSFDDCATKFRECASLSIRPLSGTTVEKTIETIGKLESVDEIGEIIKEIS